MSRSIVTYEHRADAAPELADASTTPPKPQEDNYKDRLLKYIPGEVVTLYLTLTALAASATGLPGWVGWAILAVAIAGTWFYLRNYLNVTDQRQLSISTLSFCVWAFALGGPFATLSWYKPIYGGLLLPIFTFVVAGIKTPPVKP
jgi:hypothetical protein